MIHLRFQPVLLCLFIFCSYSSKGEEFVHRMEVFSDDNVGIEHNVESIVQDKYGFLWFTTNNGLCRYDGSNFHVYYKQPNDRHSLPTNRLIKVIEDENYLWITSESEGLIRYNYESDDFNRYLIKTDIQNSNLFNFICNITPCANDKLWLMTPNCLYLAKKPEANDSEKIHIYQSFMLPSPSPSPYDNRYTKLLSLSDGSLLVGTKNGLFHIHQEHDHYIMNTVSGWRDIEEMVLDSSGLLWIYASGMLYVGKDVNDLNPASRQIATRNHQRFSMTVDRRGNIWATDGKDLYSWRDASMTGFCMQQVDQPAFFMENRINCCYCDNTNNLWIGSWNKGLGKINLEAKPFFDLNLKDPNTGRQIYDIIRWLTIDSKDRLWIATKSYGLILYDPFSQQKIFFRHTNQIPNVSITYVYEDRDHNIWVCSAADLYRIEERSVHNTFGVEKFSARPDFPHDMASGLNGICEDKNGNLWITSKRGYFVMKNGLKNPVYEKYLGTPQILRVYEDPLENNIWFFSRNEGVSMITLDQQSNVVQSYSWFCEFSNPHSLTSNNIWVVKRTSDGRVWVGADGGLNVISLSNNHVTRIPDIGQYRNIRVSSIIEVPQGKLWLNTTQGIMYWDPETGEHKMYNIADGLKQNVFNESGCVDSRGRIYVGGRLGVNYFDPISLHSSAIYPLKVQITGFLLNNQEIMPGDTINDRVLYHKSLLFPQTIQLRHNENNITFRFSNLYLNNPTKNICQYILEGYDTDWITAQFSQCFATYNSLPSGQYVFRVKASDGEGNWSKESRDIAVVIYAPWWNRWWAYVLYGSIALWILYRFYLYAKMKQQLKIEYLQRQSEQELAQMKFQFFTELTHELRTPLMLVSSPIEELIKNDLPDDRIRKRLNIVHNSCNRLLDIVNKYLEYNKVETGRYPLNIRKGNIVMDIKKIVSYYDLHAIQRKINYQMFCDTDIIQAWYDRDKIETILINLLTNAFKFTPSGGNISLFIDVEVDQCVTISVHDTGYGINPEDYDKIFLPYYQIKHSFKSHQTGTGIGLSLVKKLVELHHGSISVFGNEGGGSVFKVRIPIDPDSYGIMDDQEISVVSEKEPNHDIPKIAGENPLVLIVEDDKEFLQYIAILLKDKYKTMTLNEGKEVFDTVVKYVLDLILLDINLPGENGIEIMKQIKQDFRVSHIPIIIVSGESDLAIQINALKIGAIDYLQKPFSADLLIAKVDNQIHAIYIGRKHQSKKTIETQLDEATNTYMAYLTKIIIEHIEDPGFGVDQLCALAKVNRMQLHRKLKVVGGISSSELIRNIRMEKAKELLMSGKYNVSEVYFHVGYNSHSYFTKVFKDYFGVLPSEIKW